MTIEKPPNSVLGRQTCSGMLLQEIDQFGQCEVAP